MKYRVGDILKSPATQSYIFILGYGVDLLKERFYKIAPLHDMNKTFRYSVDWVDENMDLAQEGGVWNPSLKSET